MNPTASMVRAATTAQDEKKQIRLQSIVSLIFAAALVAGLSNSLVAHAQQWEVKIGIIYDYTGPFAAGGSQAAAIGTKIAIDMVNERGGVEGYKIVPIVRRRAVQG